MPYRPWIADKRVAATLGVVLFIAACLVLYDAYDRRGGKMPAILKAFTPM